MIYKFSINLSGCINDSVQSNVNDIDMVTKSVRSAYIPAYIEAVYPNGTRIKLSSPHMHILIIEDEYGIEHFPNDK